MFSLSAGVRESWRYHWFHLFWGWKSFAWAFEQLPSHMLLKTAILPLWRLCRLYAVCKKYYITAWLEYCHAILCSTELTEVECQPYIWKYWGNLSSKCCISLCCVLLAINMMFLEEQSQQQSNVLLCHQSFKAGSDVVKMITMNDYKPKRFVCCNYVGQCTFRSGKCIKKLNTARFHFIYGVADRLRL